MVELMRRAREREESPLGRQILDLLLRNQELAAHRRRRPRARGGGRRPGLRDRVRRSGRGPQADDPDAG
ncbi:MAG: hypothetical protein ACT4PO_03500 [Actinomycetota bacterium]